MYQRRIRNKESTESTAQHGQDALPFPVLNQSSTHECSSSAMGHHCGRPHKQRHLTLASNCAPEALHSMSWVAQITQEMTTTWGLWCPADLADAALKT